MDGAKIQRTKQGCANGAERVRTPLQQTDTGTQQAQQVIDDGDEQRIIDNDALSFSSAFTGLRDR